MLIVYFHSSEIKRTTYIKENRQKVYLSLTGVKEMPFEISSLLDLFEVVFRVTDIPKDLRFSNWSNIADEDSSGAGDGDFSVAGDGVSSVAGDGNSLGAGNKDSSLTDGEDSSSLMSIGSTFMTFGKGARGRFVGSTGCHCGYSNCAPIGLVGTLISLG